MSRKCQSWRPDEPYPAGENHRIGSRPWWRPCRAALGAGESVRCAECSRAISTHPSAYVRMALAEEEVGTVSRAAIETLTNDSDVMVALLAEEHLERLRTRLRSRQGRRRVRSGVRELTAG